MTDRSLAAGAGLIWLALVAAPAPAHAQQTAAQPTVTGEQPSGPAQQAGRDRRGEIEIHSYSWSTPQAAPADRDPGSLSLNYGELKPAESRSTPRYTLTQGWPSKHGAPERPAAEQTVDRSGRTIDGSEPGQSAARSSKPKEIVVVGSTAGTPSTEPLPNDRLKDKPNPERAGLLVPAIQKVREPAARMRKPAPGPSSRRPSEAPR